MPFVNLLIQRDLEAGLLSDHTDQVLASDRPSHDKMWSCWLSAERAYLRDDLGSCFRWLTAGRTVADTCEPDDVWLAEYQSTLGRALQAQGEPARAFRVLLDAYDRWRNLADGVTDDTVALPIADAVAVMIRILLASQPTTLQADSGEAWRDWLVDRLILQTNAVGENVIELSATVGADDAAREVGQDLLTWLPTVLSGVGLAVLTSDVYMHLGNCEQAMDHTESAVAEFEHALDLLAPYAGRAGMDDRIAMLRVNRANGLVRLDRIGEAVTTYDWAITQFRAKGDREAVLRTRYARLFALRRADAATDLARDLRGLAGDYEEYLRDTRDSSDYAIAKANIEPVYRLLLTVLAESGQHDEAILDELFGIVAALRAEHAMARLEEVAETTLDAALPRFLDRPLALLDRRLARLPGTTLLLMESGVDRVVFLVLTSGEGAMAERASVALSGPDLIEAANELLTTAIHDSDLLIAREVGIKQLDSAPIAAAGEQFGRALPAQVVAALSDARAIIFSPSALGASDELPFELVRLHGEFLGLRHTVARIPSLRQLLDVLAPNRRNRSPGTGAVVVRAEDPADLDPLVAADQDAEQVVRAAAVLGLQPSLERTPTAATVMDALDTGIRLVHYVGHGMASETGEALFLSEHDRVRATQLEHLRGTRTPFVYLSACLVGRARHLAGGRQKGFGVALLEAGAPTVVASTYSVPDHLCAQLAQDFYRNAWKHPLGEALRRARSSMHERGSILSAGRASYSKGTRTLRSPSACP